MQCDQHLHVPVAMTSMLWWTVPSNCESYEPLFCYTAAHRKCVSLSLPSWCGRILHSEGLPTPGPWHWAPGYLEGKEKQKTCQQGRTFHIWEYSDLQGPCESHSHNIIYRDRSCDLQMWLHTFTQTTMCLGLLAAKHRLKGCGTSKAPEAGTDLLSNGFHCIWDTKCKHKNYTNG